MEPQELAQSGLLHKLGARIVTPEGVLGTCRSQAGNWRMLDYFVVHESLLHRVLSCGTTLEDVTSPHKPVMLRLRDGGPLQRFRALRLPSQFPKALPVGPPSQGPDWTPLAVGSGRSVDELYGEFSGLAEQEVASRCHLDGGQQALHGQS